MNKASPDVLQYTFSIDRDSSYSSHPLNVEFCLRRHVNGFLFCPNSPSIC